MNVTVGLLPPRRGTVSVYGSVVTGRPPEVVAAQGVALVPQGRRIFKSLTVRENLEVAWRKPRGGLPMLWTLDTVSTLFPRLRERQSQIAGTLSGGEQQMLAIGRALMSSPRVLMMDEPSLGLAPILVETIFQIVAEINQQGIPILLVEQNAHKALEVAHRAYVLETGSVVKTGPGQELLQSEDVARAYLGM
jgi:branched-chain amino acid transport system ATP-binding protein